MIPIKAYALNGEDTLAVISTNGLSEGSNRAGAF